MTDRHFMQINLPNDQLTTDLTDYQPLRRTMLQRGVAALTCLIPPWKRPENSQHSPHLVTPQRLHHHAVNTSKGVRRCSNMSGENTYVLPVSVSLLTVDLPVPLGGPSSIPKTGYVATTLLNTLLCAASNLWTTTWWGDYDLKTKLLSLRNPPAVTILQLWFE